MYNPETETLRTNIKIYDDDGNTIKSYNDFPIYSYTSRIDEQNGWDTIELDISDIKNRPDDADISVSFSSVGKTVYADSAWIEYTPAGLTQKYDTDSVLLYNMGSREYKDLFTSDGEYARVLVGGSGYFDTAGAEDSTYAYKWACGPGNCLKVSRYGELKDINLKDYASKGYNLVFRMKSEIPEGVNLPLNLWFSPEYRSADASIDSTNYPASKTFYVTPDAWHDYTAPLSSLSAAIADNGTINTILWQTGGTAKANSVLYIDRIFLAKQQSAEALAAPTTELADTAVNRYLQGGSKVHFTFGENLKTTGVDYVSAVKVQKGGEKKEGAAVSVNGKTLSIIFADALDDSAQYTITLNKDYILSTDGKKMDSNYTKAFTTTADACAIENASATKDGGAGKICNNTKKERDYIAAIAAYKDDSLKAVKLLRDLKVPAMTENELSLTFDEDVSHCDTFKVFVWSSAALLTPFANK